MSKTGKNLSDLLDLNRSNIINYILRHPGCSRTEIGKATGLTLASITKIMHSLIECGAICETGYSEGKKGRRSVGLSFVYERYKVLAIHLSWNRLEMQPMNFLGESFGELISIPLKNVDENSIYTIIQFIVDGMHAFCREFPEIAAIGMAVPGPCYRDTGSILLPPYNISPEERCYFPLKEKLAGHTKLPIFIEHDADAGALAYWLFYASGSGDSVIMNILADNGIGIGLVDHGHIFTGTNSSSCEMGHITIDYRGRLCPTCGARGCINAYCSTNALERIALENLADHPDSQLNMYPDISYQSIYTASQQQDEYAKKLIWDCGHYMGHGILSLLQIFNPDLIVISGLISLSGELLMSGIQDTFSKSKSCYTMLPKIKLFPSEQKLTLLGGAAFAIQSMLDAPTKYLSLHANEAVSEG